MQRLVFVRHVAGKFLPQLCPRMAAMNNPQFLVVLSVLLLSACTGYREVAVPESLADLENKPSYESAQSVADQQRDPGSWWSDFGGEELVGLVEILHQDNFDLWAARARLRQAEAATRLARSSRLPSLSLSQDRLLSKTDTEVLDGDWSDVHGVDLNTSWDTDIFGVKRSTHIAVKLREQSARLNEVSLRQSLTAELVKSFVAVYFTKQRIEINQELVASFAETRRLTEFRYRAGSGATSALDLQIALQNEASSATSLPALLAELETQQHRIDIILARTPGTTQLTFSDAPDISGLAEISLGRPADLLSNRPDVAAAELSYLAACLDVDAARASLAPTFTLSAGISSESSDLSNLFDWDTVLTNLTNNLLVPIYNGGALRAQVSQAEAIAEELAASYVNSAFQAFGEVESNLAIESGVKQQVALLERSEAAAEISDRLARERFANGQLSILNLLETRRSLFAAREERILAEKSLLDNRVDLYLAMGGQWFSGDGEEENE